MTTTVEILKAIRPALRWTPEQGEHTTDFIERTRKDFDTLESDPLNNVLLEAQRILGRCVPPTQESGTDTGLVVGYVQSGKTLSFTTVMALARDNGYQLIILLAGVAVNLKSQSERRLVKGLGLEHSGKTWTHFENPDPKKNDKNNIQNALDMWTIAKVPAHKRRTVLITVLKNHKRLQNLVAVLRQLKLDKVPTLVIDDEADQASLNNEARTNRLVGSNEVSTTYDRIVQLKATLPHHTFLQYTATPQANLLIGIADILSPSFAELVTAGDDYVGGKDFFVGAEPLVRVIPLADIPSPENLLSAPPPSLQSALRLFLLGAAAHTCLQQRDRNRSMMVHPSQKTAPHADYKEWVEDSIERWKQYFNLPIENPAYQVCTALFRPDYKSLLATFPNLPTFDELMDAMTVVLLQTTVVQVNSTSQGERDVRWNKSDYWILIGGQKLDRGFTVEGLTVTYMPRPLGSGNADTLQQRARFFGYKKPYEGLCRVFLIQDVKEAFEKYVEHEEVIRSELEKLRGQPLMNWKRDFILTRTLNPTRSNVVGLSTKHVSLDKGWVTPGAIYKDAKAVQHNRELLNQLVAQWNNKYGTIDSATIQRFKDRRAESPRNLLIQGVPLQSALEQFILRVRVPDFRDSTEHTAVTLAISRRLEQSPNELCDIFLIAELKSQTRTLVAGRINQVFSGKSPNVNDFDALNYVGDRALHGDDRFSLHLRIFDLNAPADTPGELSEVPWFAIHLPARFAKDSVIEAER